MDKIANPQELVSELNKLMAQSQEPNPSRERLAADLKSLAARTSSLAWHSKDIRAFLNSLNDFYKIAIQVASNWEKADRAYEKDLRAGEDVPDISIGEKGYPFRKDFDQICNDIKSWVQEQEADFR